MEHRRKKDPPYENHDPERTDKHGLPNPGAYMPQEHPTPAPPYAPQPDPRDKKRKKERRFHFRPGLIFRTFLMLSGAAAWIFLILKYAIVPLLSLLSGNG